ncbi:hypothetical protein KWK62_018175, partial [Clostridioides difficile]|nr:hypothetical protein [Clostridioides difficile]
SKALLVICKAISMVSKTLLVACKALLAICKAVSVVWMALLIVCKTVLLICKLKLKKSIVG